MLVILPNVARFDTLEAGKSCDLAIWEIERPAELVYRMGFNPLYARVWRGASQSRSKINAEGIQT